MSVDSSEVIASKWSVSSNGSECDAQHKSPLRYHQPIQVGSFTFLGAIKKETHRAPGPHKNLYESNLVSISSSAQDIPSMFLFEES